MNRENLLQGACSDRLNILGWVCMSLLYLALFFCLYFYLTVCVCLSRLGCAIAIVFGFPVNCCVYVCVYQGPGYIRYRGPLCVNVCARVCVMWPVVEGLSAENRLNNLMTGDAKPSHMASGMAVYLVGQGGKKTFTYLKVGSNFHLVWREEKGGLNKRALSRLMQMLCI